MHGVAVGISVCYTSFVATVVLSYKLKLFPTSNKADTLAPLSSLFCRTPRDLPHNSWARWLRLVSPPCVGKGEFIGRAYRRAWTDYRRMRKAARALKQPFKVPTLRAELIR